jgi:hypothetical protein
MYKKVLTIAIIAVFLVFMISRIVVGLITVTHSPKTAFYFKGIICGAKDEIGDAKYFFKTYDENMIELRTEPLNAYLGNNITINYLENERYVKVYALYSKEEIIKPELVNISLLEPDAVLDLAYLKGETIYFCLNMIQEKKKL